MEKINQEKLNNTKKSTPIKFALTLLVTLLLTSNIFAQISYFNQDPCMQTLMDKGCTEVYETLEYADPAFLPFCPKMKVRITLSKLVCNGKVVSVHIWSAGAWAPDCKGASSPMSWEDLKALMSTAVDNYASSLVGSLGLDRVLVSTGSVCKAEVTFEMPPFTSSYQQEGPGGSLPNKVVTDPGGKYTFTLPCKSDLCCFGYADVVDNKVVGVTPEPNPAGGGCPTPLTDAEVMDWFKQTFQVAGGDEKKMFNIVISPCEEKCDLSKLVGNSEAVWLKSTKPTAGQKLDYNVNIVSIKDAQLTFKSDMMPTHYQILDINGKVIENKLIQSNVIDIKPLAKGIFFFKANYNNGISSVVKFVKD